MKHTLIAFLSLVLFSQIASSAERNGLRVFGEYGLMTVPDSEFNSAIAASSSNKNNLRSYYLFGGGLAFKLGSKFELVTSYEHHGGSFNNGANFDVTQEIAWLGINYKFLRQEDLDFYVGLYGGYSVVAHLVVANGPVNEYDADRWPCGMALVGAALYLGNHFSLFGELGYQRVTQGTLRNTVPGRPPFTAGPNTNVPLDLNGGRVVLGAGVTF